MSTGIEHVPSPHVTRGLTARRWSCPSTRRSAKPDYAMTGGPPRRARLTLALAVIAAFATPTWVSADTLTVPDDYSTIQAAIDASFDGDLILVDPGDYEEAIDFLGKNIRVESSDGASVTSISTDAGSVVKFTNGESETAVLDGFTITLGVGEAVTGYVSGDAVFGDFGGGVYCLESSPSIQNCIFTLNEASSSGGAIYAEGSTLRISDCTFTANDSGLGGAVSLHECDGAQIIRSLFNLNVVEMPGTAGALSVFGAGLVEISECEFTSNSAFIAAAVFVGEADLLVKGCLFDSNSDAFSGGALTVFDANVEVIESHFRSNEATIGGAVLVDVGADVLLEKTLIHDTTGSLGGAIHGSAGDATLVIENCTLTGITSTGGAIRTAEPAAGATGVDVTMLNCIVWECGAEPLQIESTATVEYSDVEGGAVGLGNFDLDPEFLDATIDDFRLLPDSPCIDTGDPMATDDDGSPRDVGAFPYRVRFVRGDVNGSGAIEALVDAITLLDWQFYSGPAPLCDDAADVDDNGEVWALIDSVALLTFGFGGAEPPPSPGVTCGFDPTDDSIDCDETPCP